MDYETIPLHKLLIFDLNLCYNLMKKSKLKILANQKIHCLGIVERKQNTYDYTIEKYKRKMIYLQKNNPWYKWGHGPKSYNWVLGFG